MSLHEIYDRIENGRIKLVKTVSLIAVPVVLVFLVWLVWCMPKPDFSNQVFQGIVGTINK